MIRRLWYWVFRTDALLVIEFQDSVIAAQSKRIRQLEQECRALEELL